MRAQPAVTWVDWQVREISSWALPATFALPCLLEPASVPFVASCLLISGVADRMVSQGQVRIRHSNPKIGKSLIALTFGVERSHDHMSILASFRVVAELEDKPAI